MTKWLDIDKQQPNKDEFIFFISEEDNLKYKYDDPDSKWWPYDFGVDTGIYWKEGRVEIHCDMPDVKIKYWHPVIRFDFE